MKKQERYKEEQTQKENATHISTQETTTSIFPTEKMTKENKGTEQTEQREHRLETLQRQGTHLCPNDTRFLLRRQAARLSEENQRIFYTKVIELAEAEKQERQTQERLQQVDKNDGRTNSSRTKRDT